MQIESENFHSQIQLPSKNNKASKRDIAKRINEAAIYYKNNIINKDFLILFEGNSIEFSFTRKNFLHFCGVEAKYMSALDFFKKASKGKVTSKNFYFTKDHPFNLASLKTENLINMFTLLQKDSLMITDLYTKTKSFKLGAIDCNIVICLDFVKSKMSDQYDLIPFSLRVEDVPTSRFNKIYEVDYVLSKEAGSKEYNTIEFGNQFMLDEYLEKHNITKYNIKIKHNYSDNNENENDMPQIKQEETLIDTQPIEQSIENVPINNKSKENIMYEKSNQDINDDISEEYDDDFDIEL